MRSGDTARLFMTSALDVGEWSASRFTLGERAPSIHWGKKVNISAENQTPVIQPVARRCTNWP
jgi:hypothetical protein